MSPGNCKRECLQIFVKVHKTIETTMPTKVVYSHKTNETPTQNAQPFSVFCWCLHTSCKSATSSSTCASTSSCRPSTLYTLDRWHCKYFHVSCAPKNGYLIIKVREQIPVLFVTFELVCRQTVLTRDDHVVDRLNQRFLHELHQRQLLR
jgi:hypothetical protein